jgi:hypothetical protein
MAVFSKKGDDALAKDDKRKHNERQENERQR